MQLLVAGCAVKLEGATAAEMQALRTALGQGIPVEGPPHFVLRSQIGTIPMPERKPDRVVQHIRYWEQDEGTVAATGPGLTALVSAGRAILDPGKFGVRGLHGLLLPVLSLLFGQQGACLIHAAAFLDGDEATLVLGGSGKGKSTLVTAALSLGLGILGDDLLVLRLNGRQAYASGIPIPLALPGDQAHHPAVGRMIAGDPRERCYPAEPARLAPGGYPIATVLLVEHSTLSQGQLRPATGRAVLGATLGSTLEGLAAGTARRAFPFAAAVAATAGWHFGHAADPRVRVEAAAKRLQQLSSGRVPA